MHGLNRPIARQLAPIAPRRPKFSVQHGVELVDEYAWLRADNWQEVMRDPSVLDSEIRTYLEAENAYTEAALADTLALQQTLYAEMKARIKEDDSSVPAPDGAYEYFVSYVTGGQYPRVLPAPARRRPGNDPDRRQRRSRGQALLAARAAPRTAPTTSCSPTPCDDKGSELLTMRIRDLATGKDLPDTMPDTRGCIVWSTDSRILFYVRLDANQRPLFVYRHRVGTPAPTTCSSTRRRTSAFTSASARRSRASTSPSMRTTTRPPRST